MKNLRGPIEETKMELARIKPRSRRHVELEIRLRNLIVQQLRREARSEKKTA